MKKVNRAVVKHWNCLVRKYGLYGITFPELSGEHSYHHHHHRTISSHHHNPPPPTSSCQVAPTTRQQPPLHTNNTTEFGRPGGSQKQSRYNREIYLQAYTQAEELKLSESDISIHFFSYYATQRSAARASGEGSPARAAEKGF